MNSAELKAAFGSTGALVFIATQRELERGERDQLRAALDAISTGWQWGTRFKGRAAYLVELVEESGILSTPQGRLLGVDAILEVCQFLIRHIDSPA